LDNNIACFGSPTMTLESDHNSPADRRRIGHVKAGRSRITNGSAFLPKGHDGRSAWVRRCKDIIAEHTADKGGQSNISAGEASIIRRISALTTELEILESRFAKANGNATTSDLDLYIRGSGALRRLLETIGLDRRARVVGEDYITNALREELGQ
jgi:hypothetical protein